MYLDFLVKIPEARSKLLHEKRGDTTYIKYEYDRTYDQKRQYTLPLRATIGKQSKADETMMQPNQNFLKYFPESELPLYESRTDRSSCLRIGAYTVISKIIRDYKLNEILGLYLKQKDVGLFLDLVTYSIIAENNAGQYYPMYAYNHPLFTDMMKIYSDSTVSDFLQSITADQSVGFLNEWNRSRNHREKIYISYDSTNKNCQSGDIEMVEFGKAKVDMGAPVFNYAIAYDTNNREPLFYEKYPGSINDVSQLQLTLNKAVGYGYKKIGFILDRGYFSKNNIEHMDMCGYSFVIMVKGMASFVNQLVLDHRGSFENKRICDMDGYGLYGKTVKRKLYETDKKERYFHIYHSVTKEAAERTVFEEKLRKMRTYLLEHVNEEIDFGQIFQHYFYIHYDESGKVFVYPEERIDVTEKEIELCGYFVIVTSDKMTAKEAINLYKSRDASEKLFSGDKSYLGNKSIRVHSDESASAKIFVEFIALIVRSRMYTNLLDEMKRMNKKPNYMTVPAAIRELEKIEMVRQTDNVYRLDHAVTATQKTILGAFGLNDSHIKNRASEISNILKENKK